MNIEEQKEMLKRRIEELENQSEKKKELKKLPKDTKSKFYTFDQNNSGGSFQENDKVCELVIVEAYSADHANLLADDIGIYFEGCSNGLDCSCCGDRWHPVDDRDGYDVPSHYGKDITEVYASSYRRKAIIHYLNGTIKKFTFKTWKDCPGHKWEHKYGSKQCTVCDCWESEMK
jgi:hypothetical protein